MSMPTGKQPEAGPFARAVSAEFRAVMARKQVSGPQLAKASKISQSYLSRRLRNEVAFTANDIEAICKALEVSLFGVLQAAVKSMASSQVRRDRLPDQ
ncbi:Cro/C1-type HTH DNA-binding domain-containing protein [Arthrobacter sp. cf158]|uniref:helix-turn-helix domain-containing protein n=1 Tax=Arthrobacter sp. cf158 TaxID=1761744 RepID=UPI000895CABF|nr:helix-turn-helix transcriptional regulator [Arthrobacter sp. cf158]SDW34419.1 Cro/C1-type HTH DNA-binding domain-containing protein [Arthrobacter sp. cf158]